MPYCLRCHRQVFLSEALDWLIIGVSFTSNGYCSYVPIEADVNGYGANALWITPQGKVAGLCKDCQLTDKQIENINSGR